MDEIITMTILLVIVNGAFDAIVVAYLAGKRSKKALVSWLQSPEAIPYMDQIAERAMMRIEPTFQRLQTKIDSIEIPIIPPFPEIPEFPLIDMTPTINEMERRVNAMLIEQSAALKSEVIESSKMSFKAMQSGLTRGLQKELSAIEGPLDDFAAEVMNQAAASMNPQDMLMAQIMQMDVSDKFAKDNPLAALALRYGKMGLLRGINEGTLPGVGNTPQMISNTPNNLPGVKRNPFGE